MARIDIQIQTYIPKAPDDFISGLLSVALGQKLFIPEKELHAIPGMDNCWTLISVCDGEVLCSCNKRAFKLRSAQIAAFRGDESVAVMPQTDAELTVLVLRGNIARSVFENGFKSENILFSSGGESIEAVLELIGRIETSNSNYSDVGLSSAIYEMLMALYRLDRNVGSQKMPQIVEQALALINQNVALLEGAGELAEKLGVSQEYLTRVFRNSIGTTPGKYLNQIRVEHAKFLLRQHYPVSFVSDACGFTNSNYFARVFRGLVGMNPGAYSKLVWDTPDIPDMLPDSIYVI